MHVAGTIASGKPGKRDIAIAVNGTIEAVSRSFFLEEFEPETFSAVVPEWVLRQGRNDVRVFEVRGSDGALSLVPLDEGWAGWFAARRATRPGRTVAKARRLCSSSAAEADAHAALEPMYGGTNRLALSLQCLSLSGSASS